MYHLLLNKKSGYLAAALSLAFLLHGLALYHLHFLQWETSFSHQALLANHNASSFEQKKEVNKEDKQRRNDELAAIYQ
jgi:hypothetical protein